MSETAIYPGCDLFRHGCLRKGRRWRSVLRREESRHLASFTDPQRLIQPNDLTPERRAANSVPGIKAQQAQIAIFDKEIKSDDAELLKIPGRFQTCLGRNQFAMTVSVPKFLMQADPGNVRLIRLPCTDKYPSIRIALLLMKCTFRA